tara:strand:+ start:269 stop:499 length:231 start_codon:yes stop_codon:yes gene_type:complete
MSKDQEVQDQEVQEVQDQEVQDQEVQDQEVQEAQDHNTRILKIWKEKGVNEAVKQMFVHPINGRKLDYAEMRAYYG